MGLFALGGDIHVTGLNLRFTCGVTPADFLAENFMIYMYWQMQLVTRVIWIHNLNSQLYPDLHHKFHYTLSEKLDES